MQYVMVYRDPLVNDPTAFIVDPGDCNIWTNDNEVTFKILVTGWVWDVVVFQADWIVAGGQQPTIDPDDETLCTVIGPPANNGPAATGYTYTLAIRPEGAPRGAASVRVGRKKGGPVVIDPDVWNQPQP